MHSKREFFVTMSRRRLILFAALAIRTLPLGQLLLVGCLQQLLWASPSAGWIPSPPIIRGGSGGGVGKSAISTSLCKQRPPRGWFTDSNVRPNRNNNKRWTAATANTERRGSNSGNGEAEAVPEHLNNKRPRYDLGIGKNKPKQEEYHAADIAAAAAAAAVNCEDDETILGTNGSTSSTAQNWMVPESVVKPESFIPVKTYRMSRVVKGNNTNGSTDAAAELVEPPQPVKTRRMVARDNEAQQLRGALWDEQHYNGASSSNSRKQSSSMIGMRNADATSNDQQINRFSVFDNNAPPYPTAFYPDIDLSIPDTVYSMDGSTDLVWDLLRWEAYQNQQQQYEPLLVSFLHSTILNHATLESSLAFLLANRLQSPAMMISTQLQALLLSALQDCPSSRRKLRADIMAVRDRDPACHTLPDVFLYFKGFHALQSHRAAHVLWNSGRQVLAQYLQSQVSQIFQIDIHPNATIGSGIMLDHGTGIVIGETATVGHNCSILHHVTLGGSGKQGVVRHPAVGNGVLLGAGATVLGPVSIGDGSQVGAGTLVISDLPAHCVAVGVPARIIGSFIDVTEQPSIGMNQIMEDRDNIITFFSDGI